MLARGLAGAHGVLATRFGVVVCEAYAGRVRVFASGRLRTLAGGLGNPSYAVAAPEGVYVTEFGADQVSEISRSGRVRRVGDVLQPGPIARAPDGALLVASLDGTITRLDPRSGVTRRVYPR